MIKNFKNVNNLDYPNASASPTNRQQFPESNTTKSHEDVQIDLQSTSISDSSNKQQNGDELVKYHQLQRMVQQLYMAQGQVYINHTLFLYAQVLYCFAILNRFS